MKYYSNPYSDGSSSEEEDPSDPTSVAVGRLRRAGVIGEWRKRESGGVRRTVPLNITAIRDALVELYAHFLAAHPCNVKEHTSPLPDETLFATCKRIALAYITGWCRDLTYCLRHRTEKKAATCPATKKFFQREVGPLSSEYDDFLVELNSHIGPYQASGALEESLWIPEIIERCRYPLSSTAEWEVEMPLFEGALRILRGIGVGISSLDFNRSEGLAGWLLDWHDGCFYAWFPFDKGLSYDAVPLVILGCPMTQLLAPCDSDDSQLEPLDFCPDKVKALARVERRRFFGATEVRTVERWSENVLVDGDKVYRSYERLHQAPQRKRQRLTVGVLDGKHFAGVKEAEDQSAQGGSEAEVGETKILGGRVEARPFIRIHDYTYFCRVTKAVDFPTRLTFLREYLKPGLDRKNPT